MKTFSQWADVKSSITNLSIRTLKVARRMDDCPALRDRLSIMSRDMLFIASAIESEMAEEYTRRLRELDAKRRSANGEIHDEVGVAAAEGEPDRDQAQAEEDT